MSKKTSKADDLLKALSLLEQFETLSYMLTPKGLILLTSFDFLKYGKDLEKWLKAQPEAKTFWFTLPPFPQEACAKCKFWSRKFKEDDDAKSTPESIGRCRKRAPMKTGVSEWPQTRENESCGDYLEKIESEASREIG